MENNSVRKSELSNKKDLLFSIYLMLNFCLIMTMGVVIVRLHDNGTQNITYFEGMAYWILFIGLAISSNFCLLKWKFNL